MTVRLELEWWAEQTVFVVVPVVIAAVGQVLLVVPP